MKKILCSIIALLMIFNCLSVSALEEDKTIISEAEQINETIAEDKIFSDVKIEDNFETDSIIVVMKNLESRKLKEFTKNDFSEISAVSVKDLTKHSINTIKEQRVSRKQSKDSISNINENQFHQFLQINLPTKSKKDVLNAIKTLEKRDDILIVEANEIDTVSATPNDPRYTNGDQWAINKISLPSAWDITIGSPTVNVGIIDTGIEGTHDDLKNVINTSLSKDFIGNSPLTDENGHGTHVGGTVGAQGNNSIGVAGVAWNIKLVSLKAGDSNGSFVISDVCIAIDYAKANSIPILNYSAGGNINNAAREQKINEYGGLFVCAAGNDGGDNDIYPHYPSNHTCPNLISVANSNSADTLSNSSNYGITSVDLAAPGSSILSTVPGNTYAYYSGTSMASPHVAGVAALLLSNNPNLTNVQIKEAILNSVDVLRSLTGKLETGGRLNAYKALQYVKKPTQNIIFTTANQDGILSNQEVIEQLSAAGISSSNSFNAMFDNSVTGIGYEAFYYCSGLKSVTIPNSVISIGDCAFQECSGLTSATIGNNVISIGEDAFYNCIKLNNINIPNSVITIGMSAFSRCQSLTSIVIPDSVTSIGIDAFYYCTSLTSVKLPSNITRIESSTFSSCTALTSITIPNSVTSIGDSAFNFTGLTNIQIPAGVTYIGTYAFYACSELTAITLPVNITNIGAGTFGLCTGLKSITIPNSVTSIGESAFWDCTGLTSITIPNSVISIGDYTFRGCNGLTSITIPDSVKSIGISTFSNCSNLSSVKIGSGVIRIGDSAFSNCTLLANVYFNPLKAPTIGPHAFYGLSANAKGYIKSGASGYAASYDDLTIVKDNSDIRTIYFTNNKNWSTINAYLWKNGSTENNTWPGAQMTYVTTNGYNEKIYSITFDYNKYDMIIFNAGNGQAQTVDINVGANGTGYYLTGGQSGNNWLVDTYVFSN